MYLLSQYFVKNFSFHYALSFLQDGTAVSLSCKMWILLLPSEDLHLISVVLL